MRGSVVASHVLYLPAVSRTALNSRADGSAQPLAYEFDLIGNKINYPLKILKPYGFLQVSKALWGAGSAWNSSRRARPPEPPALAKVQQLPRKIPTRASHSEGGEGGTSRNTPCSSASAS